MSRAFARASSLSIVSEGPASREPRAVRSISCRPSGAASTISASSWPPSLVRARAERSSRLRAASVRRPAARLAGSSVRPPFSRTEPRAKSSVERFQPSSGWRARRSEPVAGLESTSPARVTLASSAPCKSLATASMVRRGIGRASAVALATAMRAVASSLFIGPVIAAVTSPRPDRRGSARFRSGRFSASFRLDCCCPIEPSAVKAACWPATRRPLTV